MLLGTACVKRSEWRTLHRDIPRFRDAGAVKLILALCTLAGPPYHCTINTGEAMLQIRLATESDAAIIASQRVKMFQDNDLSKSAECFI
jgi:hypothetical protein